jgi:membrane protease YdiL (CAAX protease family)
MHFNPIQRQEENPYTQLLYLLLLAIGGLVIFAVIGFVVIYFVYGMPGIKSTLVSDMNNIGPFKILLVAQQIGLFLAPAIFLNIVERKKISGFYGLSMPKASLLGLVAVLSLCWMPIMGLVNEWNQAMVFPDFLKGIEKWMREMEDQNAETTEAILKMNGPVDLLVNLLVIAVTPAICEEFIFRGALQRTVFRLKSNPHVAIWLSAIIFSTIHFQFYGFIPRMLLGAAFGYIYFFTGSIWYAVFAHFLNNAFAVIAAYVLQSQNKPYTEAETMDIHWIGYVISAILTLALFKFLKERTSTPRD